MASPLEHYRIQPGFGACLKTATVIVMTMAGTVAVLSLAASWWLHGGVPPSIIADLPIILAIVLLSPVGLGLLLYLVFVLYALTATREGLRGSTGWKWETIPWSELETIETTSFEGIPALVLKSSRTGRKLTLVTLGLEPNEVYPQLAQLAGTEHPLTQCFAVRV